MAQSWDGVRVLVTGASGFFGANAVARVQHLGAQVYGLVRQPPVGDSGIRWLSGDLTDSRSVRELIEQAQPQVVLHLAGQTIAAPDKELVLPSFRNNLASTVNVLLALTEVGCQRVVVTGSLEEPHIESGETVPVSPYGASKWGEVMYARMFHALYRLPVVIVRPFISYGPHQRAGKLVPSLTLSLLRGETPVISQPDREADWIYIDDVIEGILAAGLAPSVEGKTIELGTGVLTSIRNIAKELERIVGGPASVRIAKSEQSVGVHGRQAELDMARQLLGWHSSTALREGLVKTVAWYRSRLNDYPNSP